MSSLKDRVVAVLSGQFKVKAEQLTPEVTLGELSFDSLVLIELTLVLENEFGVTLADDELSIHLTVDELVAVLESKGALV